jgi:pyruvate formate lyase activating enzyme
VHPALLTDTDVAGLALDLAARGVRRYVIQAFRSQGCADEALRRDTVRERPLQDVGGELAGLFGAFSVRA